MMSSEFERTARSDDNLDASTAARLLDEADRIRARASSQTDFRAHAVIQGWAAAAVFVYVATFLLLFANSIRGGPVGGSGHNFANVLLIPFLVLSQLVQGARNRLPVSVVPRHRGIRRVLILSSMIIFLAAATATILGFEFPWWAILLVAVGVAAPLGGLTIGTARRARGTASHPHGASPRPTLSRTAAVITAGLGAYLGVFAALTPYSWFPLAALLLTGVFLVQAFGWNARWGLPNVGSDWGQSQWVAFGVTFTLLFALTIVAAKTNWNTPLVATLSSIVIAAPLVRSALRTYRRQ